MNLLTYNFDLICHLVRRDFSLRYKRSALGVLWSLMQPLAQLIVLVFLFGRVVPLNIEAYPVFVFSALLPWTWFSTCLSSAGSLFAGNRDLVRRPNFIPANLVIVNVLSNLLTYLLALPILFVMLALYDRAMTLTLFFLPLLILIQGILIAGLGLIIAILNVFYRDVQYIMAVVLMLLFYLTPVFYQPKIVGESYRNLYILNPIAVLIESYRAIFFYGTAPEWGALLLVGIACIVVCGFSYLIYSLLLHEVIDTI
ncbi:Teichoic acid translocation permease protein TagG [uncultured bacterium]|nr:Teichoic acid translocation permease protein TagG [uncultured bacterium]